MMKQLREIYLIFPLSAVYSLSARTITLTTKDDINVIKEKKKKQRGRKATECNCANLQIYLYVSEL